MKKFTIILTVLIATAITSNAQWQQTSGPTGGTVNSFAVSEANIFAGASGGVFLSTNNGSSWSAINTGLTNTDIYSFAISGTDIFARTNGVEYGYVHYQK